MLFVVGASADAWAHWLGVRLASIEAVCLSHWHADHSVRLPGVVRAFAPSPRDEGLPARAGDACAAWLNV